jgi:hypothetical protein
MMSRSSGPSTFTFGESRSRARRVPDVDSVSGGVTEGGILARKGEASSESGQVAPVASGVDVSGTVQAAGMQVQRMCADCAEEEEGAIQRLQRKGVAEGTWLEPGPAELLDHARQGIRGPSGKLPYLDAIQHSFGRHDVRHVQAHTDAQAGEAARAMRAMAFTTGEHVAFDGQPSLHTAAHEAAHVVQQRAGGQLQGGVGEVGDAYERQADAVAERVVRGRSIEELLDEYTGTVRPQADVHWENGHELQQASDGTGGGRAAGADPSAGSFRYGQVDGATSPPPPPPNRLSAPGADPELAKLPTGHPFSSLTGCWPQSASTPVASRNSTAIVR